MTKKSRPESALYPKHHKAWDLEPHYSQHIGGMTEFELHDKSDIAEQLAWRDKRIADADAYERAMVRALGAERLKVDLHERRLVELARVAHEAAAMLAETNHGGLTHARSESMRKALERAGVEVPKMCSECPEHANMRPAK